MMQKTESGETTASLPNRVDDLMITFSMDGAGAIDRTPFSSWKPVTSTATWKLWFSCIGDGWKGYPLTFVDLGTFQFWLLGELHAQTPQPIEMILQAIGDGQENPSNLNGHFLLLAWNREVRQWHIWTHRFGTLHAYYAKNGERTILSTFFPAAAQASRRQFDWIGLTGFFAFGFFPQDRTYYEDVRILQPASHYVFAENGGLLRQERRWQWWHEPDSKRSYDDTVAEFGQVLKEAQVDQTREGQIAIPISGGLDSRTAVALITQSGQHSSIVHRLWAYSYGYAGDSIETRIARQVAAARNLPFRAFTIGPYLFDRLDLVLDSVDGFQDITQSRQAAIVEEISCHADYLIAGHLGDLWLNDIGLLGDGYQAIDEAHVLVHAQHKMEKKGREWLLEHLCQPQLGQDEPELLLREIVGQEMANIRHIEDPEFRIKAFKTDQWVFRWTNASLRMFKPAAFPRLPFYDTRVADFFCTVPSQFVRKRQLQIDYLKRFAPDLAHITWQVYDTSLFRYQHFNSWLLPKRALKKAWRVCTRKHIFERNWEVQFLNDNGRQRLEQWLLRPGLRLHDLVSPKVVRDLVDAFYTAPLEQGRGYTVSMLLTFSAWLERYG